jgi:hypothetical protein
MEDEMTRDREQPLNPPGIDAPDRKIVRKYIPMREYDDIEANGYHFYAKVEVESCGAHDEDLRVRKAEEGATYLIYMWQFDNKVAIPERFEDSYISRIGETWRTLIEREICRQAALLPCTAWEVEYGERICDL